MRRRSDVLRQWPVAVAVALFLGLVIWEVAQSVQMNGGHLIYPIDDAHLQMTMARTLADRGTDGLSPGHPAAAPSSPLWVMILAACFRVVHAHRDVVPLVLNAIWATVILVSLDAWLLACGFTPARRVFVLAATVVVLPLPSLAFAGLEHTMHVWVSLAFAIAAARSISRETTFPARDAGLAALAALLCAIRFEGAFLVIAAVLGLSARQRWRGALAVGAGGALSILVQGWYSRSIGWAFAPMSFLLGGRAPNLTGWRGWAASLGGTSVHQIWQQPAIVVLIVTNGLALLFEAREYRRQWAPDRVLTGLFLTTTFLHGQFAPFGDAFGRYEAYLVALGVASLASAASAARPQLARLPGIGARRLTTRLLVVALLALAAWPFGYRAIQGVRLAPQYSNEIWRQGVTAGRLAH